MEITVNIKAPEIAAALQALAQAMSCHSAAPVTATPAVPSIPAPAAPPIAVPAAPPIAPVTTPAAPPVPPVAAAPSYTKEQLCVAGAELTTSGKTNELIALMAQFGINQINALPENQYGAFATALRGLGAQI